MSASGRTLDGDPAATHDRDASGEAIGLLEVVRRQQDRERLLRCQTLELAPHRRSRLGIEPRGGLVEEEHPGAVNQAHGDVEAPLHPAGVGAHDAVRELLDAERGQQLVDASMQLRVRDALHLPLQLEVLAPCRVDVDAGALRHVADRAPHGDRLAGDIVPRDSRPPRILLGQGDEDLDRRRLPCPVWSQ